MANYDTLSTGFPAEYHQFLLYQASNWGYVMMPRPARQEEPLDKEYLDQLSRQTQERIDRLQHVGRYDAVNSTENSNKGPVDPKFGQIISWEDTYIYSQARKQAEDQLKKAQH